VVDLHKSIKATNRMWAGKSPVLACCLLNGTEIPLGKLRMALNLGEGRSTDESQYPEGRA
jgi:hypothetical protein